MKTGIVGLAGVGKSCIFNILTGAEAGLHGGGRKEARTGVSHVPDERLDGLSDLYKPKKTTHAAAHFVDIPGVEPGDMKEPAFLTGLRSVDALAHVVRAFKDGGNPHPSGSVNPARDVENMEMEMVFADLFQLERRMERLDKDLKKLRDKDVEAEHSLLLKLKAHLEAERPLREYDLTPEEERRVRGFTFLSLKPVLHVVNMDESDAGELGSTAKHCGLERWEGRSGVVVSGVCGKIEEELSRLAPDEAREFMADLGIGESGMSRLIRDNYRLLGLISFFTVGEDECRAWTVRRGTSAHRAAGSIHTDIEKGFIRAEVVRWDDLLRHGSFHALKERGLFRLEGKEYVVQDGDVVHYRFNV